MYLFWLALGSCRSGGATKENNLLVLVFVNILGTTFTADRDHRFASFSINVLVHESKWHAVRVLRKIPVLFLVLTFAGFVLSIVTPTNSSSLFFAKCLVNSLILCIP